MELIESFDKSDIILVSTKEDAQSEIAKKNKVQFRLAHTFLLMEVNLLGKLGLSGKATLASEMLNNRTKFEEHSKRAELLSLFSLSNRDNLSTCISADE